MTWRGVSWVSVALLSAACAVVPSDPPSLVHGPYKDVTIAFDRRTNLLSTEVLGKRQPVTEVLRPGATLTLSLIHI